MTELKVKENTDADNKKDRELVRQVKQGNQQAFTEIVARYQKRLFKMAYGFFQDRDDAMEIVQETFIRLYQKLDGFDEKSERTLFKNWVYRVAYNLCIDYYRKFKKQKVDMKDLYEYNENSNNASASMEENLDRKRFDRHLKKIVMNLPGKQKKVFILKHYNGMKHHEISCLMDLSVGTIKTLYHRSIKNLKKNLRENYGVAP